jgi:hypothetical protein
VEQGGKREPQQPVPEGASIYGRPSRFTRGWKGFASLVSVLAGIAGITAVVVSLASRPSSASAQVSDVEVGPEILAEDAAHEFPISPTECAPDSAAGPPPRVRLVRVAYTPVQYGGDEAPPDLGSPPAQGTPTDEAPAPEPPGETGPTDGTGEPTTTLPEGEPPPETTPTEPRETLAPPPEDGALAEIGPPAVAADEPVPPDVAARLVAGDPTLSPSAQELVLAKTRMVELKPVGLKLQVVVDFDGKENDCVSVRWTLLHAETDTALRHPWQRDRSAGRFTIQDAQARAGLKFFVALPARTGSYRVKVMVVDGSGRELDVERSGVFH